jgi:CubicO group peptidase (beta-lactamase class C family)
MTVQLPRSTAEAEGLDPAAVDAFVDAVAQTDAGVHGLMVVRHGVVAAERSWAPYRPELPHMMFSISKSFTSTAIGMAQDAGLLSVDEPVLAFFPGQATARVRRAASGVRLRDLLTMTSGHETDTFPVMRALPDEDWVRLFFEVPFVHPPGTRFLYNTGATYVLGAALAARTGESLVHFLTPRLFEPLGIRPPAWATSPSGLALAGTGMRLTIEDIAKLGLLYLRRGRWGEHRLLSEQWIDAATSAQVPNRSGAPDWAQGYGFQFWRSRHESYRADGAFGQFSFVLPREDTVIAITAGLKENWRIPDLVWDHLLPGIDRARPAAAMTASAAPPQIAAPEFDAGSAADPAFTGRRLRVPFNALGVTDATVRRDGERWILALGTPDGPAEIVGAPGAWIAGETRLWADGELDRSETATRAGVVADGAIEFHEQVLETVYRRVWRLAPAAAGAVELTIELRVVGAVESSTVLALDSDG